MKIAAHEPRCAITKGALSYDPETGHFTWIEWQGGPVRVGQRAGNKGRMGYRYIQIAGRRTSEHRLAWLFVHEVEPPEQVDHINGIKDDNRIANLRLATNAENNRNVGKQSNNKSGFKGVTWHTSAKKFQARIMANGKYKHLGLFQTAAAAAFAYDQAAADLHGSFAKGNFSHANAR